MTRTDLTQLFDNPGWYDEYGQRVLDVLLNSERAQGVSADEIAIKLGLDPDYVTETLRRLSTIDMAEHSGTVLRKHHLFVATPLARRSITDKRLRPMQRKCLTCTQTFLSAGAHNRICDGCKSLESYDEGIAA